MAGQYAKDTSVSVDNSIGEIRRTIQRFGADRFMHMEAPDMTHIGFSIGNRTIRMDVPIPLRTAGRFTHHSRGKRTEAAATKEWEKACRSRYRTLALLIKAKLAAVEEGIYTVEEVFFGDTVLADGRTVAETLKEQVQHRIDHSGAGPLMLPPAR